MNRTLMDPKRAPASDRENALSRDTAKDPSVDRRRLHFTAIEQEEVARRALQNFTRRRLVDPLEGVAFARQDLSQHRGQIRRSLDPAKQTTEPGMERQEGDRHAVSPAPR